MFIHFPSLISLMLTQNSFPSAAPGWRHFCSSSTSIRSVCFSRSRQLRFQSAADRSKESSRSSWVSILDAAIFTGWWLGHPSEKYESNGMINPNIWKNKTCSKPPTRFQSEGFWRGHIWNKFSRNPDNSASETRWVPALGRERSGFHGDLATGD